MIDARAEFDRAFGKEGAARHAEWSALSDERRSKALRRLQALNRRDEEGDTTSMSELARIAGMQRANFYKLVERWASSRSLGTVTPYLGRAPRRPATGLTDDGPLRPKVERMLKRGAKPRSVIDEVVSSAARTISEPTARTFVRKVAAELEGRREALRANYGRMIVIDSVATDFLSLEVDNGGLMTVCIVLEAASREILGLSAMCGRDGGGLLTAAVEAAVGALAPSGRQRGRPSEARPSIGVVMPPMDADELAVAAEAVGRIHEVHAKGPRRFGRLAMPLLGASIAEMGLRPRFTRQPDAPRPKLPEERLVIYASTSEAEAAAHQAVIRHNAARAGGLAERLGADVLESRRRDMSEALVELRECLPGARRQEPTSSEPGEAAEVFPGESRFLKTVQSSSDLFGEEKPASGSPSRSSRRS